MATYTRFSSDDVVITTEKVFTSTWFDNTNALTAANTVVEAEAYAHASSSHQFARPVNNNSGVTQFTVSYGNKDGSGSLDYTVADDGYNAARSVYGQYRSLVYGDENRNFTFNGYEPQDILVINITRANYKQSLRLGSLNLTLKNNVTLTDDSVTRSGSAVLTNLGRQYNIVSGSNGIMSGSTLNQAHDDSGSYGLFYPDAGILIFNPDALKEGDAISTAMDRSAAGTVTTVRDNQEELTDAFEAGNSFIVDSEEKISSQYYFVRARNKEFNYSTNPSFIDDNGNLNFTSMVDNPVTYITTVGLYNDANELLAVAKLSQPITKDFTKEALIKVKLDY